MTLAQDNAALAASTRGVYAEQVARAAVHDALALLVDGHPGEALYVLTRGTTRAARLTDTGPDLADAWTAYTDCLQRMEGGL